MWYFDVWGLRGFFEKSLAKNFNVRIRSQRLRINASKLVLSVVGNPPCSGSPACARYPNDRLAAIASFATSLATNERIYAKFEAARFDYIIPSSAAASVQYFSGRTCPPVKPSAVALRHASATHRAAWSCSSNIDFMIQRAQTPAFSKRPLR